MPKPNSKEVTISATMPKAIDGKKRQIVWFNINGTSDDEVEAAILDDGVNLHENASLTIVFKDGDDGKRIDPATSRVRSPFEIISAIIYNGRTLKTKFLK